MGTCGMMLDSTASRYRGGGGRSSARKRKGVFVDLISEQSRPENISSLSRRRRAENLLTSVQIKAGLGPELARFDDLLVVHAHLALERRINDAWLAEIVSSIPLLALHPITRARDTNSLDRGRFDPPKSR